MVINSLKIRIYPLPALVPPVAESSVYILTRVFVSGMDCKRMLAVMTCWGLRLSNVHPNVPCWPKGIEFGSGRGSLEECVFGSSCASLVGQSGVCGFDYDPEAPDRLQLGRFVRPASIYRGLRYGSFWS